MSWLDLAIFDAQPGEALGKKETSQGQVSEGKKTEEPHKCACGRAVCCGKHKGCCHNHQRKLSVNER